MKNFLMKLLLLTGMCTVMPTAPMASASQKVGIAQQISLKGQPSYTLRVYFQEPGMLATIMVGIDGVPNLQPAIIHSSATPLELFFLVEAGDYELLLPPLELAAFVARIREEQGGAVNFSESLVIASNGEAAFEVGPNFPNLHVLDETDGKAKIVPLFPFPANLQPEPPQNQQQRI